MMTMVKLMMMMMMMIGTGLAFRFLQWPVRQFKSVICPPLCEPQIGQDSVLSLTILNALQLCAEHLKDLKMHQMMM